MNKIQAFLKDDSGATAIEYGLIAGLIGVAGAAAMKTVGTAISNKFTAVDTALK